MNSIEHAYISPEKKIWTGRKDEQKNLRLHEFVNVCDLKKEDFPDKGKAFIGFSCDEGVRRNLGRIGARKGPESLRRSLVNLPYYGKDPLWDLGDISCIGEDLEGCQKGLEETVFQTASKGVLPIVLGGGHEVSLGHFRGLQKAYPDKTIGILNIDAHFDLRGLENKKGSSGTPFYQIAKENKEQGKSFYYSCIGVQKLGNTKLLFERAEKLGVSYVFAEDVHLKGKESYEKSVNNLLEKVDLLYLTICLDAFASGTAPGVSAPQPFGLFPAQVLPLLKMLCKSKKLCGFDVAELAPCYDIQGMTARLGAFLIGSCLDEL
jgi:formiminoglutamase